MKTVVRAALAMLSLALAWAAPAAATPGLTLTTWSNIPYLIFYPTSATIDQELAYTASATPDGVQIVNPDPYGFYFPIAGTTAIRLTGTLNVAVTGVYNFNLYADDAARLTLDGSTLEEANFYYGGLDAPDFASVSLTAGAHAFDLFAFQTVGGDYLNSYISGPAGLSFSAESVPEPAMLGLFGLGALALALAAARRRTA